MKMRGITAIVLMLALGANKAYAGSGFVQRSTDVLAFAPSVTSLAKVIADNDFNGLLQLGFSSATTILVNYGLEHHIDKASPTGDNHHSFPSTHTASAFDGATFLMRHYGWEWGVPAYAVATYVAWGRVECRRHDIWDVLGGAAIGAGCALIYTRPFAKDSHIDIFPISIGRYITGLGLRFTFD